MNFPRQKKVVYSKMHILHFYFVRQTSYQVLDKSLQFLLSLVHTLFGSNDGNKGLVFILHCWEHHPGTGLLTDVADVGTAAPNQELVVFGFGVDFCSKAGLLL